MKNQQDNSAEVLSLARQIYSAVIASGREWAFDGDLKKMCLSKAVEFYDFIEGGAEVQGHGKYSPLNSESPAVQSYCFDDGDLSIFGSVFVSVVNTSQSHIDFIHKNNFSLVPCDFSFIGYDPVRDCYHDSRGASIEDVSGFSYFYRPVIKFYNGGGPKELGVQ